MQKEIINNILTAYQNVAGPVLADDEITNHIRSVDFLQNILHFSKTAFLILDFETLSYPYCSSNMREVSGQTPEDLMKYGPGFALSKIHPDDLPPYEALALEALAFFSSLPQELRKKHRFSFTFRMPHQDGYDVSLFQNTLILKWGENGMPLVGLLTLTDISEYKTNKDVLFFISRMHEDGENEVVVQKNFSNTDIQSFSNRELEIIQFISAGLTTQEIAIRISLREDTVKNHKKNIMKKLGCTNSAHMITLASVYGLIRSVNSIHNCNETERGN